MSLDDFRLLYMIGKGAFCKVFLGHLKTAEGKTQMYAIKQMRKIEVKKKKLVENIKL